MDNEVGIRGGQIPAQTDYLTDSPRAGHACCSVSCGSDWQKKNRVSVGGQVLILESNNNRPTEYFISY